MANKIYATRNPDITPREIDHMARSSSLAGECVVLLENDGTLPLEGKGKLALFGNGARQTIRGGTGSGDVNTRSDVNIERGLEEAGFTVTTKAWLDRQDAAHAQAKIDHAAWIVEEAKRTNSSEFTIGFSHPFQVIAPIEITKEDLRGAEGDLAVYVISRTAGEGADRWNKRGDYLLYDAELEQLRLLAGLYKKLVLVLNLGGVIDMSEILSVEGINAIVLMGQLGNIGGQVLGDVLTGKVNPSGKLTMTWPISVADHPSTKNFPGNLDYFSYASMISNGVPVPGHAYTNHEEGIYVGYRHFDTRRQAVAYPFGYGLSYTTFEYSKPVVSQKGSQIEVSITIKNTGKIAGKEIAQVYVSAPKGQLDKPAKELKAFGKTRELKPGESQTLKMALQHRDLASFDESQSAWVVDAGTYVFHIGANVSDIRSTASLNVKALLEKTSTALLLQKQED